MALDLISIVLTGFVTLFFSFLGSFVMWRIVGPWVVVSAIRAKLGPIMQEWLTTPQSTGREKTVIDDSGEQSVIVETASPLDTIISAAGETLYRKMLGKVGGDKRKQMAVQHDIQQTLADPSSPFASMLSSVNPMLLQRALKDGDYIPIILEQLGPFAVKFLEQKLNGGSSSQF